MTMHWFLSSCVLICTVLLLRALLRNRLSARWRYALWLVVLARLLFPFQLTFLPALSLGSGAAELAADLGDRMVYAFPSQVYPSTLAPGEETVIDRTEHSFYDPEQGEGPLFYSGGVVIDQEQATHYFFMMPLGEALLRLWYLGMGLTALGLAAANLGFWRGLSKRRRPYPAEDCPLPVYRAEGLLSPCIFGLFRPAVYLTPEAAEDGTARGHVLAHELTHYAHRDHIWAFLRCLALVLHWYNPLVWLAAVLSKRDGELACDEGAVARLGEDQRVPYGRTLVDMAARRAPGPGDLLSCSTAMTQGKKTIQQRVALLVKKPETRKTALFAALAAVALAAVFAFAGGGESSGPSGDSYQGFLSRVEQAQAVRVGMPVYSSMAYPEPITDDDLLQEARELLAQARDPLNLPEDLELEKAPFSAHTITLLGTSFSERYYLFTQNGKAYVVTPAELGAEKYTAIAVLEGSVPASLQSLAGKQHKWDGAVSSQEIYPSLNALRDILERADTVTVPAAGEEGQRKIYDRDTVDGLVRLLLEEHFPAPAQAPEKISAGDALPYTAITESGQWVEFYLREWEGIFLLAPGRSDGVFEEELPVLAGLSRETLEEMEALAAGWYAGREPSAVAPADAAPRAPADVSVPAALRSTVERVLSDRLEEEKRDYPDASPTIHLTAFRGELEYGDLLKEGTVRVYAYDYGLEGFSPRSVSFKMSGVSGVGPWMDENGWFHDYSSQPHLLTVERGGQVVRYGTFFQNLSSDSDLLLNEVVNEVERLYEPSVPASVTDHQQAAERWGRELADYYLSLGEGHPQAVRSARLAKAEVYERDVHIAYAEITLALDPVEPNNVYWMAGAGIDYQTEGQWKGLWLYSLDYALAADSGGAWYCMTSGTGGVNSNSIGVGYSKSFTPSNGAVALTAALDRQQGTVTVDGQTGPLERVDMDRKRIQFQTGSARWTAGNVVLSGLMDAIDSGAQDLSQWLRVYTDGQTIPGTARYYQSGPDTVFEFTYDQMLPYDSGLLVTMELGPTR